MEPDSEKTSQDQEAMHIDEHLVECVADRRECLDDDEGETTCSYHAP